METTRQPPPVEPPAGVYVPEVNPGEDLFSYMDRARGGFDQTFYKQLVGAANEYKEGDEAAGLAAADEASRANARTPALQHPHRASCARTRSSMTACSSSSSRAWTPRRPPRSRGGRWASSRRYLLEKSEAEIKAIMGGLSSDIIGCVVKLMTNEELIAVGSKVFNPLPGSNVGAKGYLGARIQPNSPTDNVDDIRWQVFDGWAYGVGDVVLGTNPVSSDVELGGARSSWPSRICS